MLLALALVAAAAGIWSALRLHARNHVTLTFERSTDPVPDLELTFFPDRLAFTTPSPPPALGTQLVRETTSVSVGKDLVPGEAVVRYRGEGVGTGYVHVRLGEPAPRIPLRPATTLVGRVGLPIGFWCFGWRCAGLQPVAGAEVLVMGGGEHGIDLAGATTDAEGRFVIEGVDGGLDGLGLRVRARGFALAHEPLGRFADDPTAYPVVALARAQTHTGRVMAPAAIDPSRLLVLARGLPGVQAVPTPDGLFLLDHVPLGMEPRLVVAGLPETWTHSQVRATATGAIRIEIVPGAAVRGRVLDAASQKPLADALVWCGDQDAVRSDADGRYQLLRQLPGDVEIEARWELLDSRRRRTPWFGRTRVVLAAGDQREDTDILVTAR